MTATKNINWLNRSRFILFFACTISAFSCTSSDPTGTSSSSASTTSTYTASSTSASSSLSYSITNSSISPNSTSTISPSGGTSPYNYSLYSGTGSVSSSGKFTASSSTGTSVVKITDSNSATAYVYIYVESNLSISPSSRTIYTGDSVTFKASGGTSPYSYEVTSGDGSVADNVFTAPESSGINQITVTDANGEEAMATLTVQSRSSFSVTPTSATMDINDTLSFQISGGKSPYSYAIISGGGSVSNGYYSSPSTAGQVKIRVSDSQSRSIIVTLTVQNVSLKNDCTAYYSDRRYGTIISFNSGTYCNLPMPGSGSSCPSGWTTYSSSGVPYTITEARTEQEHTNATGGRSNRSTGYHSSFAAISPECMTLCTARNLFKCTGSTTYCAYTKNMLCYK